MKVAIIGAGHRGISHAEHLISTNPDIRVDLFERTPAPFGLIRYGTLNNSSASTPAQLRLFGNITVGVDLSVSELSRYYDHIINTVGTQTDISGQPQHADITALLGSRKLAYTSWEGWHYRTDLSQPSIDWKTLLSDARGIPIWM